MLLAKLPRFIYRQTSVRCLSGVSPFYIVNEYPKSGGTWLSKMLSSALDVADGRYYPIPFVPSVTQGHYLKSWGMKNVVILWRDGRDVMVSWYHYCAFKNGLGNSLVVDTVRRDLGERDYENVREHLSDFIQYAFSKQKHPNFSWSDFVRAWYDKPGVIYVKYEDLKNNCAQEIQRLSYEFTGKKISDSRAEEIEKIFSFERMSGRRPGQEAKNNFLRKGVVGDWKRYFDEKSCSLFEKYAGPELRLLGYE